MKQVRAEQSSQEPGATGSTASVPLWNFFFFSSIAMVLWEQKILEEWEGRWTEKKREGIIC